MVNSYSLVSISRINMSDFVIFIKYLLRYKVFEKISYYISE